jgi:hypothetical protein
MSTPDCSISFIEISIRIEEAYYAAKNDSEEAAIITTHEETIDVAEIAKDYLRVCISLLHIMNALLIIIRALRRSPYAYAAS